MPRRIGASINALLQVVILLVCVVIGALVISMLAAPVHATRPMPYSRVGPLVSIEGTAPLDWFIAGGFPVLVFDSDGNQLGGGKVESSRARERGADRLDFFGEIRIRRPDTRLGSVVFRSWYHSEERPEEVVIPVRFAQQ